MHFSLFFEFSIDPSLLNSGGGLGGLTLAIAVQKHAPSLPITLYESTSKFGEIGAGVGFEPVSGAPAGHNLGDSMEP